MQILISLNITPIYAKHKIVHNDYVVKNFERKGVIFVEDLKEIPKGASSKGDYLQEEAAVPHAP